MLKNATLENNYIQLASLFGCRLLIIETLSGIHRDNQAYFIGDSYLGLWRRP